MTIRKILVVGNVMLLAATAFAWYLLRYRGEVAWTDPSPDGCFTIEVDRLFVPFAMPGGGSDADCYVRLKDRQAAVLREQYVDTQLAVERPSWSADRVAINLLLDWPLPPSGSCRGLSSSGGP